jgi:hypothetical protein
MVINNIRPSKAPNLPIAPVSYSQQYVDQLTNAFRLYFAQIDNFSQSVGGPLGGKYLQFPHIAASDSTDQYATANNTPTVIKWNTLESGDGFTLQAPGSATPLQTGVYKITYSLQFANTANAVHDAVVWLRINGTNVSNSSTSFSIPARKSAGVPSYVCGYSELVFTIDADSVVELVWATDQAYSTTGPVNGVFIFADPAQTSPYARPAIPSAIGSITFVSAITA